MNSKFRYSDDIPVDLLSTIQRIFEPLAKYLPDWCHHVHIHCSHNNSTKEDANATISAYYDYRWASVWIEPSWFAQKSDEALTEDALHELIHIIRSPVDDWAREVIKRLVPKEEAPKFCDTLLDELRARTEMVTQDITYMLMRCDINQSQ